MNKLSSYDLDVLVSYFTILAEIEAESEDVAHE